MANGSSGGRGLNYTANLNIDQVKKNSAEAIALFKKMNDAAKLPGSESGQNKSFDIKPLTEYQAGLLKIKQDTLDFAKEKQAQQQADKQASLDRMQALADQRAAIKALADTEKEKSKTIVSDSQAEVDAYNKVNTSVQGVIDSMSVANRSTAIQANSATAQPGSAAPAAVGLTSDASTLSNQEKALQDYLRTSIQLKVSIGELNDQQKLLDKSFKDGDVSAASYADRSAVIARESTVMSVALREVNAQIKAQSQSIAAASGSYTDLQAQLSGLTVAYKAMSDAERNAADGKALQKEILDLTNKLKELDAGIGVHNRSVGDYGKALLGLSNNLGQVIPGVSSLTNAIQSGSGIIESATAILNGYLGSVSAIKAVQAESAAATTAAASATAASSASNTTAAEATAAAGAAYLLAQQATEELSASIAKLAALKEELSAANLSEAEAEELSIAIKQQAIVVTDQLAVSEALAASSMEALTAASIANADASAVSAVATEAMATAQASTTAATEAGTLGLRAFKIALLSTGIGAIIVLLGSLYSYFTETQEGMDAVTKAVEPLKIGFNLLIKGLGEFGKSVANAFSLDGLKAFGQFLEDQILNRFKAVGVVLEGLANFDFKQVSNGVLQGFTGVTDVIGKTQAATKALGEYVDKSRELGKALADLKIERDKQAVTSDLEVSRLNLIARQQGEIARDSSKDKATRADAAKQAIKAINDELIVKNALLNLDKQILQKEDETKGATNARAKAVNDLTQKENENSASAAQQRQRLTAALNRANKPDSGALKAAKALSQQLTDSRAEALRAQKTADDSEVAMVRDKYEKQKKIINDFYANPKNSGYPIKIDNKNFSQSQALGYAKTTMDLGESAAQAKVTLDADKEIYAQQKVLFDEYNDYVLKNGETAANARFGQDITQYKNYVAYLKAQQPADTDQSVGANMLRDYLSKALPVAENAQAKSDQKRFTDLLEATQAYQQKSTSLNEAYQANLVALGDNATAEQKAILKKGYQDEMDALIDSNFAKTDAAKRLGEGVLVLTRSQIKDQIKALTTAFSGQEIPAAIQKQIDDLKKRLNIGADQGNADAYGQAEADLIAKMAAEADKASPKFAALNTQLVELIKNKKNASTSASTGLTGFLSSLDPDGKGDLTKGALVGLGDVGDALSTFSTGLEDTNADAAYTLDTLGKLASSAANLGLAIASGDPQKIIQASIQAVGTLFSLAKKTREANLAAQKEVADYYAAAIAGEKEYQALLLQRQIDNAKNNKNAIDGALDEYKLRTQQLADYKQQSTDIIAQLQGLTSIATEAYEHGTWFKKAKVNKTYNSLNGITDFETLSNLLSQGKLEGQAKDLVTQLVDLEQKGVDAQKAIDDLAASTNELFTGTTSDNLTDSLLDMFKSGKTGAQDLADFFKQTMDDAALSIFKNTILQDAMDTFYKEFAEKAKDGNVTDQDRSDLQNLFDSLTDDAKKQFELLKEITGSDLTDPTAPDTPSAIQGTITAAGLTEDTGNELKGIFRGTYDLTKTGVKTMGDIYLMSVKHFTVAQEISANTLRTANNTDVLSDMAKDMKLVVKNTGGGTSIDQALRDKGINLG